jgi:uncharacterized membrane protein YhiD involved in acid resistance
MSLILAWIEIEVLLKISLSIIVGGFIGFERKKT